MGKGKFKRNLLCGHGCRSVTVVEKSTSLLPEVCQEGGGSEFVQFFFYELVISIVFIQFVLILLEFQEQSL